MRMRVPVGARQGRARAVHSRVHTAVRVQSFRDTYAEAKWRHPLVFTPQRHARESAQFARATFHWHSEVWLQLVARDDDDCVELSISPVVLDAAAGHAFTEDNAPHEWSFETPVCGLGALGGPDAPLATWHTGLAYPAGRESLYPLHADDPGDYRQVRRTFRWPMQVRPAPAASRPERSAASASLCCACMHSQL